MGLIVESGAGISTAESYLSVTDADRYHELHGRPASWTGASVDQKEVALRQATQYLDAKYANRWIGSRRLYNQRLAWPRYSGAARYSSTLYADEIYIDGATLPQDLLDATAELALRYLQDGSLLPDLASPGVIQSESVSVGSIAKSTTYQGGKSPLKQYTKPLAMLNRLIGSTRMERF
jgi:hypothetical protein